MIPSFLQTSLTFSDLLFLLSGAWSTLVLTVLTVLIGTSTGLVVGVTRAESGLVVSALIGAVVDVIRSVPLMIQLIVFNSFVAIIHFPMSAFASGLTVLSIYMAAICSEIARAGVQSVPSETRRAARSLGMSYFKDLGYIVLPIGLRTVFPTWIGAVLGIMKDTALVLVLGYFELLKSAQTLVTRTQEPLLVLILAGVIYFGMSYPISRLGKKFEQRAIR